MANDEVLGPRKTMFVLVIVVGCFAVLWPRILSPLIVGHSREQLKPNQFDRDAAVKQERPPIRMGPHPAMKERGRAIPPGAPAPPKPVVLPPHLRVRSPLSVYYELDIKPPPIPGMRPPLGSPGGPVPAPKSSMGFVMPIYTICIIVFFVYTLSKILFKRTGAPYEPVAPDPQFRRRVFRDESRSSPDKLVVSAISGLVAEVQQQMESSYAQNQQRQDALDSTRPYTNGSIVLNSGPVQIITSEHQEPKEKTPEPQKTKESSSELKESDLVSSEFKEKVVGSINEQIDSIESKDITKEVLELDENVSDHIAEVEDEINNTLKEKFNEYADLKQHSEALLDTEKIKVTEDITEKQNDVDLSLKSMETNTADTLGKISEDLINEEKKKSDKEEQPKKSTPELLEEALKEDSPTPEDIIEDEKESSSVKVVGMEMTADGGMWPHLVPATPAPQRPHEAEEVKSIFLETDIPQQSRVLVSDFAEDRAESPKPAKIAPLVVSGKITLSLIQDAPRDTPERDPESTVDDFTTASAFTQHAEKQDDLSDEEIEEVEEIEVEEIEEEIEEEEEVEEDEEEEDIDVKRQK